MSQQPLGQDEGLQAHLPALVSQAWPLTHDVQVAPAVPHAVVVWLACARHVPFDWQQPFGHEAGVQTHLPVASQVWPAAHAVQAPPWVPHA